MVAPLLAARVFFANTVDTQEGLKNVQWVYLGVACFVTLLIVLFWLVPMPEITDADMYVHLLHPTPEQHFGVFLSQEHPCV